MGRSPLFAVFIALLLGGCPTDDPPAGDGGGGGEEGDACEYTADCRPGLVCAGDATCQRPGEPGTAALNEGCASNGDCQLEYVCSSGGVCATPGQGAKDAPCNGNEDCQRDLLCSALRKCASPGDPGTKVAGDPCEAATDCAMGLVCAEGTCTPLVFWAGADCTPDDGELRAYFEIPRGGKPLSEFYRLPFPNDIRRKGDRVYIHGHPNPATALPPEFGDVVGAFFDAINADVTGFGVNTATYLRFSKAVDLNTLTLNGDSPTVQYLDITPGSPGYGNGIGLVMGATTGRGKYICHNWMALRPTSPLRPLTTYAVLVRAGVKDEDGVDVAQDDDFELVIGDTAPTDAEEKAAWDAYKPLRDYLADKDIDPTTVLSAAVFTTMDPRARMAAFRDAIYTRAEPQLSQLTLCDGSTTSPCDDGESRGCPDNPNPAFHELQAVYQTPVYQDGTPPYRTVADGGKISYDANGAPIFRREEEVCLAMTIPKGEMPPDGWPVVIFAHGTGGSYRTFIGKGTAAALADLEDASGTSVAKMAMVGIDGSMHGPRQGANDKPDDLFFNLRNPKSARDNVYQGAADKIALVRLLKSIDIEAGSSPTGEGIKFDVTKIYYFGHSQGAIEGVPFLAFEPDVAATLLSGAGGYLIRSLLEKTQPVNIAAAVQLALADGQVKADHPLLNLLQLYFEEVDTLNYGAAIVNAAEEDVGAKHTFLSYGTGDTFTVPGTIEYLTRVMNLPQVTRCGDDMCTGDEDCNVCPDDCPADKCEEHEGHFAQIDAPVSGNIVRDASPYTAAMLKYTPHEETYDGHHVVFLHPLAKEQSLQFLGTCARDGVPTIPAPE